VSGYCAYTTTVKRCYRLAWRLVSILATACCLIHTQTTFATLRGTIRDTSDAAIPKAVASLRNVATGAVRTIRPDAAGAYSFFDLPPSTYEMTVTAPNFASHHRTGIELTVGSEAVVNYTLSPSPVQSTIDVRAELAGLDLESAALSGVEGVGSLRELPLNGRDWTQLALLQPGVSAIRTQNSLNGSSSNRGSRGFGSEVSIGGGRPTQNNYFLDGISLNDYTNGVPGSALGLALGTDAIQEFSVLTNNYSASYGGASGGVVNALSRSGGNAVHGDVYEFLRNDRLDARNFFDGQKPPFRRNQFGAAAGGPIQRDKTFFFVNYEGLRQALTNTSIATVPSAAARAGDLSTGNIAISPAIVPYLVLWPLPNGPLLGSGDTGQYIFTAKSPAGEDFGVVRGDGLISAKDSLALSGSTDRGQTGSPDGLNSIFVDNRLWRNSAFLSETHIFNPQVVNAFRAGVNRVSAQSLFTSPGNNPAASDSSLGISRFRA